MGYQKQLFLKKRKKEKTTIEETKEQKKEQVKPDTVSEIKHTQDITEPTSSSSKITVSKDNPTEPEAPSENKTTQKVDQIPSLGKDEKIDTSSVKEKKMKMVKKKKKKATTAEPTDTSKFEEIIDTKPEETETYIVDEPESPS